jgi:hypothetical protein
LIGPSRQPLDSAWKPPANERLWPICDLIADVKVNMMGFDFSPTRENSETGGAIRTVHRSDRMFPCTSGERREEVVYLPRSALDEIHEFDSGCLRTSLDLVTSAFCATWVLVDNASLASR